MKSGVNGISWPGWETVRIIGRGSFGAVYEIAREVHGRTERAALKVISIPKDKSEIAELRADDYDDASITRYFADSLDKVENEYAVMVDMKGHPNVVYCEDIKKVQHDDGFGWDIYIKMELLTSLKDYLKSVRVDEKQIVRLGMDMCSALSLCREMNVVHRDIKPENIFVTRSNSFKLGDFGIARTMEKTSGGTKTGTYDYMAPEVNWHQEYHTEVDIYSLGLVLYWILNDSRLPFVENVRPTSSEKAAARERRFRGEALPTPQHGSKALKAIVLKACAFDPKERYADPAEMKRELEALLYGKTTELRPAPEPEPLPEVVDEPEPDITVGPEVPANDEDEITVGPVIPQMETDKPEEDVTIGPELPQVSEEEDEGGTVGPESLKPVDTNTVKKGSRGGWILAIISIAVFASALLGVFVIKHLETVLPTGTVLEVELEAYKEYLIEHTDASASSIAERINAKNAIQNCDTIEELQECIYVAALLREDKILDYIQWAGVSDKKDTSGHAEPLTIAVSTIAYSIATLPQTLIDNLQYLCDANGWTLDLLAAEGDAMLQYEQVSELISRKPDYLVLFPADPILAIDWCAEAQEAGIPTICMHVDVDPSCRENGSCIAYCGIDNQAVAVSIYNYMVDKNGGGAAMNLVEIGGVPVQADYIIRTGTFNDCIAGTGYTQLGDIAWAYSSRSDAQNAMEQFIDTYGSQIDILVGFDDDLTMGGVNALKEIGMTTVQVYSIGGTIDAMEAIQNGEMTMTVFTPMAAIAQKVVAVVEALEAGEVVDYYQFIDTPVVDASNVDDYINQAEFW